MSSHAANGVIYPKLAVIGCGLIGSSIIHAARAAGVVGEVAVADASPEHRARIADQPHRPREGFHPMAGRRVRQALRQEAQL